MRFSDPRRTRSTPASRPDGTGFEVSIDGYNLLGLKYPDDAAVYVSNWSLRPGQQPASLATHITAAPPTTLASVGLYF